MAAWKRINQSFWLALRDLRCYFLFTFKPEYVERQIKLRKGVCPPNCGLCCVDCKYMKNKRCTIYKKRFQNCRDSPIDRFDLWLIERFLDGRCALYWDAPETDVPNKRATALPQAVR